MCGSSIFRTYRLFLWCYMFSYFGPVSHFPVGNSGRRTSAMYPSIAPSIYMVGSSALTPDPWVPPTLFRDALPNFPFYFAIIVSFRCPCLIRSIFPRCSPFSYISASSFVLSIASESRGMPIRGICAPFPSVGRIALFPGCRL